MKGWIELCSDVNWEDYHGMWARKAKDGKWYILQWTNMWDACGKEEGLYQYNCDVKMLDLKEIRNNNLGSALESCGLKLLTAPFAATIENERGEAVTSDPKRVELIIVECCIQYGFGAPLESFAGSKRPLNIRAKARRFAESMMRNSIALDECLQRPVNKIGSTAQEYGRRDIDSAMNRGPFDTAKQIIRKMHGLNPVSS